MAASNETGSQIRLWVTFGLICGGILLGGVVKATWIQADIRDIEEYRAEHKLETDKAERRLEKSMRLILAEVKEGRKDVRALSDKVNAMAYELGLRKPTLAPSKEEPLR
jgi:hypothetical protein